MTKQFTCTRGKLKKSVNWYYKEEYNFLDILFGSSFIDDKNFLDKIVRKIINVNIRLETQKYAISKKCTGRKSSQKSNYSLK